jgi:5-formyltetrahydrofolate cyclo-ligase
MSLRLQQLKADMRKEVKARLETISRTAQTQASANARRLLLKQAAWQNAASVLGYAPLKGELDIWSLLEDALKAGKQVALPRFNPKTRVYEVCRIECLPEQVEIGRFGIREPVRSCEPLPLNRLDFALVPGVAFDLQGRRLGRGKGYYDCLLAEMRGKTCGVAFDEQIVRAVPVEPHDSDVNCILTPTRWIEL